MLPSDVVRHIASFLPAVHAPVVEHVWKPKLERAFYDSLRRRDGYRSFAYGPRSGIKYTLHTRSVDNRYVTTVSRNGRTDGYQCYHGHAWETAKDANDWLVRAMYVGHRIYR